LDLIRDVRLPVAQKLIDVSFSAPKTAGCDNTKQGLPLLWFQLMSFVVVSSSPFLLLFFCSLGWHEFVDGYGEQGREEDNTERQKGFQNYVVLFDNAPNRQYGNRRTGDDADKTYDKTDKIYRG